MQGQCRIECALNQTGSLKLRLYDGTGRLANTSDLGVVAPGIHQVKFPDLAAGVYFVHMVFEPLAAQVPVEKIRKFVLIR
jgi:hypothetical protein